MVDVNVDFIFENEQPINADFQLEPDVTYTADIMLSSASSFHNELYNRDLPDQHPMGAITGLEEALSQLNTADEQLEQAIADEVTARQNADITLQENITAENNRAVEAEEVLDNKIDSEADTRADEITRVEGLISDEETRAEGVEGGLREDLTAEENRATNAEGVLQSNITAEENRAKGVEQQLTSSIDSNHQAISNHVSDKNNPHEVTKAQVGLGNVENLAPADMPISTATKTYVDNADNGLQGQITTINTTIGGYGNIVTHNISEFATASQGALADTALQPSDNISELTNNLSYQTATQVANSIAVETNNRESADNNLQSQIDAIVSSSDVFDIVGTYAELQAYNISTVPVNDIIKVLEDSTHGGAATYYRCIETNNVKSWSYIGSEGASYTKAEADNKFVPQTRTVNNKALSSDITLTATDVGALPSSTVIPTVNDATVTIQKNGSTVSTFTLNQSSNETVNLTVPTKTSDLTNDSGYITSASLPTVNNGQLDIQVNGSSIATFTANQSGNTTANIVVPDSATWGNITGTLSDQTDLQNALNAKANSTSLATVATSGSYNDLLNKPTIPTKTSDLTNDSNFATVSQIPTNNNQLTNGAGYITGITSSDVTTALGYTPYNSSNPNGYITGIDSTDVTNALGYTPVNPSSLATVATSGDYDDLTNKPSIPTATSDLNNDSGFITVSALSGYATESWVTNKGYITGINSSDVTTALGYTPADQTHLVNGAPISNSSQYYYGTSSTAAATVQKEVTISGITELNAGQVIVVKPTVTSTVANSTLKLNNFSAYPMRYNNANITTSTGSVVWSAKYPTIWLFDGDYWVFLGHGVDSNTTYSVMSVAEGVAGTVTSSRVLRSDYLKEIIETLAPAEVIDQTYSSTSTNAQSGTAVAEAISTKYDSSNPAGYITSSALTPYALSSSLSAVATSGAYADLSGKPTIPTVNNPTITITQGGTTKGSFTLNQSTNASIDLDSGGSSTITYDGVTIDTNSSDELEAIGTVNKNTAVGATAVKYDWIGTLAEYNSQNVETLHPEWICYITDDVSGGTSVYTKAETDSAISNALDNVYTKSAVDTLISGLLANTTSTVTSNYIRLGDWLVQWGTSGTLSPSQGANAYEDILFQQNFANTNYTVILSHINGGSGYAGTVLNANNIAVGSFRLNCWGQDSAGTTQAAWVAIGKGA